MQKALEIFMKFLLLIVAVLIASYLAHRFVSGPSQKNSEAAMLEPFDPSNLEFMKNDQLVVINYVVGNSKASEQLSEILAKMEADKTFGDRVVFRSFDVDRNLDYARQRGVNIEDFRGFLDFETKDREFAPLMHETSPDAVHEKIQACLDGLVKRFDRQWKPVVPGMERQ